MASMQDRFHQVAQKIADAAGRPFAFGAAIISIILWLAMGPLFAFSDTWQLVINTGTTIITFLMVFLIQNTQNRDAKAIHLKLDELIRSQKQARNALIDLEDMSEDELKELQTEFAAMRTDSGQHFKHHGHRAIQSELKRRAKLTRAPRSSGDQNGGPKRR